MFKEIEVKKPHLKILHIVERQASISHDDIRTCIIFKKKRTGFWHTKTFSMIQGDCTSKNRD